MKLIFVLLSMFALFGCSRDPIPAVVREELFTFQVGRLEDQIAIYNLEGDLGIRRTNLAMRDGLFYISDGAGAKIVRYNSYGNPLFMIYNEETNPLPMTLQTLDEMPDGEVIARWAFTYPLQNPGKIVVDSRKHIYVEDRLPDERHSFDPESGALLNNVVLHFDADGAFVEYLGREGIGGSPFPKIEGLYSSVRDELAVVCRLPTGWNVYWFDADGMSLYLVEIREDTLPIPPGKGKVFVSLDGIAAAPDARKLYIKADYYRDTYDASTNTRSGNEPESSLIWVMQAEDGSYQKTIEVPFFESPSSEGSLKTGNKMFYSLLGIIKNERIFLQFPVENGYSILILTPETREQQQGFIQVRNDELQFNAFSLSPEGILSALLAGAWDIKLVWWRTDKFIESF
ncbi:MAG: hypothetical protein LBG73_03080 [Spirochaetaceae bacterium]|jgi:uncharacterized protein YcfL|nr:hypothetical protein [Spirochaetaceae bacterium]